MSEYDAEAYAKFYTRIEKPTNLLRVVLEGLQARSAERQWLRHQTAGDVDESKLIEGEEIYSLRRSLALA